MPYLFKLTKRLARTRSLVILAAGVAACTSGEASVTPSGNHISRQTSNVVSTVITAVALSPASAAGTLGQSAQFTATAFDSGTVVSGVTATWSSTDSTIVAVSTSGFATAVGVGQAMIVATMNGVSGQAQGTVSGDPIASIALSPTTTADTVGQKAQFKAMLSDASGTVLTGRRVLWTTSSAAVVTVDTTGNATAIAAGSATITATSAGKSAAAAVTVTAAPQAVANPAGVTDLAVSSIADTTATLSFTQVTDGTGQPATYEIRYAVAPISWGSATNVARGTCATPIAGTAIGTKLSCSINGLVPSTAYNFQIAAFRGVLTASPVFGALSSALAASTVATVVSAPIVASITLSPATASGAVGLSGQFSATLKDANGNVLTGQTIVWTSTNTAVASVSSTGYATAVGAGSAAIVASSGGKSGQAVVSVSGPAAPASVTSASVSPSSATITVGATQQLTATFKDASGNVLSGVATTWSSSNAAVATVSGSGLVTGVAAGTAAISATSSGVTSTSAIAVSGSSTVSQSVPTGWANAPSSYPTVVDNPFNALDQLGWRTTWNNKGPGGSPLLTIGQDSTAPLSPPNVLQFSYPIGFVGSQAPAMEYYDFAIPRPRHVYGAFWWKANANWQGNNAGANKLVFFMFEGNSDGSAGGGLILACYGVPGGPYYLRSAMEISTDLRGTWNLPGAYLTNNKSAGQIVMGQWHQIEWQIEGGTFGTNTGIMRWWLDGVLVGELLDVTFPSLGIMEFQISPTFGGTPDVKTQQDYFWYDHAILKGY